MVNPLGVPALSEPIEDINIYPNPAINNFTLEFNTMLETPINIYMINALGEKVSVLSDLKFTSGGQGGIMKRKYEVDTRNFTEGIYHLQIVTEKGTVNRKVILFR